jgi:tetratricopeptide (TPR) repeat protein
MFGAAWIQKLLRGSIQNNAATNPRDWLRECREIERQKNWPRLVEHCEAWVQAQPNDWFAWHSLGNADIFSKQHGSAIVAYRQALHLKPSAATWGGLSYVYHLLNETDDAIKALHSKENVMRNDSDDPLGNDVTAWVGLALEYHSLNQPERMEGAFQHAQLLTSKYPSEEAENWFTIGLAYLNTRQTDKVQEIYERLLKLDAVTAQRLRDAAFH